MEKNALITYNWYAIFLQAFLLVISFLPFAESPFVAHISSRIVSLAFIILLLLNIYMENAVKTYTGRWGRPLTPARASMGFIFGCFGVLPLFFIATALFFPFDALAVIYLIVMIATDIICFIGGRLREPQ